MKTPDKPYRHRQIGDRRLTPESQMMGYGYDPRLSEGSVKVPIFQTSTFAFNTAEEGKSFFQLAYGLREQTPQEEPGLIYSRINNPNLQILEERLTLWENAESALVFTSGMAAIATTMLAHLRPGDVVVHSEPLYGGTEYLIENILPQFGIEHQSFNAYGKALDQAVESARAQGRLGMVYLETPANPTNDLFDIAACEAVARAEGGRAGGRRPIVVVDNTFLGPLWQRPLDHGADLVVYSLTKYVGGHSDLVAGGCLGLEAFLGAVRGFRTILGTISDPHTAWLLMRSMETMKLRMTSSMKNARYIAEFLNDHPKVRKVHYLGFLQPSDEQYAVYQRQCRGAGSTFSFDIHGGEQEAFRVLNALQLVKLAVSLGGTESLMQHPATMTHSDVPAERLAEMGVSPAMLRLSVGIEHPEDVIADLKQALDHI